MATAWSSSSSSPCRSTPSRRHPGVIEVDITDLIIGGAIRIADVTLPAGVTTDLEDDVSIVMGQASRVVAVEGEEEEGAEGAVAAPVEGAAESTDSEG